MTFEIHLIAKVYLRQKRFPGHHVLHDFVNSFPACQAEDPSA